MDIRGAFDSMDRLVGDGEGKAADSEVGFAFQLVPEPAATKKYIYLALGKLWSQAIWRIKTDDRQLGMSFSVPAGQELVVAFVRDGAEEIDEPLREGAILFEELLSLIGVVSSVSNSQWSTSDGHLEEH